MSVMPIGHLEFTRADIHVLLNRGCELVDRGLAGACVPVETEAGELVIALLDYDHQCLICAIGKAQGRSEEHTSELQSLMRISYAVFCLKKKKKRTQNRQTPPTTHTTPPPT